MITYLRSVHKHLIVVILIDLILVLLFLISSFFTGINSITSMYDISLAHTPLLYAYTQLFTIFFKLQNVLLLSMIGYLFTGSRYTKMIQVIGKNKSTKMLITLLAIAFPLVFIVQNAYLNSYIINGYIGYSPFALWQVTSSGLLIYHLLFHSNLKYSRFILKLITTATLIIASYSLYKLPMIYTYFNYSMYWAINSLSQALSFESQVVLSIFHLDLTAALFIISALLTLSTVYFIETEKVGK